MAALSVKGLILPTHRVQERRVFSGDEFVRLSDTAAPQCSLWARETGRASCGPSGRPSGMPRQGPPRLYAGGRRTSTPASFTRFFPAQLHWNGQWVLIRRSALQQCQIFTIFLSRVYAFRMQPASAYSKTLGLLHWVIKVCVDMLRYAAASPAVFEILGSKRIGVTTWPFGVTWHHSDVTIRFSIGHFLLVVLWNQASISLSLTVSEIFNGECDLKRPLNKGEGLFWRHFDINRFLIYHCQYTVVTFVLGRTV